MGEPLSGNGPADQTRAKLEADRPPVWAATTRAATSTLSGARRLATAPATAIGTFRRLCTLPTLTGPTS